MTHDSMEFYSVYKSRSLTARGRSCPGQKRYAAVRIRDRMHSFRMRFSRLLMRSGRVLFSAGVRLAGHRSLYGLEPGRAVYE
jgi:hypothetical protein